MNRSQRCVWSGIGVVAGVTLVVGSLALLLPQGAYATHQAFDLIERCQLALGKSLGKYARDRVRCIASCNAGVAAGDVPASECVAPFSGATHDCIERAETKLDKGFYYPECAGHCPECYGCGGVGDAYFDNIEATHVADTDSWVDGMMAVLFCDDAASGDGLTAAEGTCQQAVANALARYAKAKATCLFKCRKGEAKGKIEAGMCNAASVTNPATTSCINGAQSAVATLIATCTDPPECAMAALPTILSMVDTGMASVDGAVHCSIPLGCGDTFGLQCDGACPAGRACINVAGECVCQASVVPCGTQAGAPECWGTCPPELPVCHDDGGNCVCENR